MTTIAYDGKTLAADSRRSLDGVAIPVPVKKIRERVVDGRSLVWALAGTYADTDALVDAFVSGKLLPSLDSVLLLAEISGGSHRMWLVGSRGDADEITGSPYAIGSGREYALGALTCGASAVEAVRAAGKWDSGTGGDIISGHLLKELGNDNP